MTLNKNTIVVEFINIKYSKNHKLVYNMQEPLNPKQYQFFITPQQKKQLDIGNVIEHISDKHHPFNSHYMVIVDNVTKVNANQKYDGIADDEIQAHHLRHFIKDKFKVNHFAQAAYSQFRNDARPARIRVAQKRSQNSINN